MKEYRSSGRLRLGVFYAKRLARLWPVLLVLVLSWSYSACSFRRGVGRSGSRCHSDGGYVMNLSDFGAFGSSTR
ncbi:UNVERIFIED_ORG: hypothetical protein ABIB52_003396 [Arthrobacter sp. UYCu721]